MTVRSVSASLGLVIGLVLTSPPAAAQGGDALINEVMRKGKEGDAENGFCATTGWRIERSTADTGRFYSNASRGTAKAFQDTYSGSDPYCGYILVDNITRVGGRRCVHSQMWWCHFGKQCYYRRYRGCEGADGVLRWDN